MDTFRFSSKAMELIEQDRKMLLGVNTLVFVTAAFGVLSPVITSAVSDGASILATLNSMRSLVTESGRIKHPKPAPSPSVHISPDTEPV